MGSVKWPCVRRSRAVRPTVAGRTTLALLTATALATGCSGHVVRGAHGPQAPPARAVDEYATRLRTLYAQRAVAAKRWGVQKVPLAAPPPPAQKPVITFRKGFRVKDGDALPPVFTTVPTKNKVVFLTVDDSSENDPAFVQMMNDLKIPYTAFLSDNLISDDYDYFRKMRDLGITLDNQTLNNSYLPTLPYETQREEICGMQDVMSREFGTRPTVFRPPYGNYDKDTLRAAKSCGIKYAPIWDEEVFADHWEFREWDGGLHPGDIVLTHLRGTPDWQGTMPDSIRLFLDKVTSAGYAVARLEDYL